MTLTKMLEENIGVIPRLYQGHLMELIKETLLEAFSPDRNRKAWAHGVCSGSSRQKRTFKR